MKRVASFAVVAAIFAGCAVLPGKGVEKEKVVTLTQLEYDRMQREKTSLEQSIKTLEEKIASIEKERALAVKTLEEKISLLERERAGEKVILLFDGKIRYMVDSGATMDYEEAIIEVMLANPAFKEAMDKGGKDADLALVSVLKEMSPDDRRITREEIRGYLKKMKTK